VKHLLVIDQSTSATKAVLLDVQENKIIDKATREHRQHYPQAGWVEHDAEEIWQNVLAVCGELLRRQSTTAGALAGISITNQRETVVVFDRVSGRPLHPAIVWQCRRGDALCELQRQRGREPYVRATTGLRIDGYFSASKLQWLMGERPPLAELILQGRALIGTMDAYLVYRLTEGAVFATDTTNASRTLLYDITKLNWDDESCALWQVPRHALPEVRDSAAAFGQSTLAGQLAEPLPICGVMGDSQAALLAQGYVEAGDAKVTIGSGSSVLLNVGHEPPSGLHGSVATLAWVYRGRPTYALEGIVNCSAATLNWLRDQLGIISVAEEAEALAHEVDPHHSVYLVPAFAGLGAPHWRSAARAAIVGLSAHSDRRNIIRAALEAIAYQIGDVLDMIRRESGIPLHTLQADGGACANDLLMQFTADILGIDLKVADHPDCSARGAGLMGALGLGLITSLGELASLPRRERTFRRKMSIEDVQLRVNGWRNAVQQVLCVT
jgi:glycerol kinase